MAATINGKRRRRGIFLPPLASLFLSSYLSSSSSSYSPLCTRSTPLHALEHQFSPTPPPLFLAAAVNSSPPVKDWLRRSSFLILGFAKGLSSLCCRRFSSSAPVGAAPRSHRSAADPRPLPSFLTGAFPSLLSSPSSSTHREQKPPLDIPSSCAFLSLHELAGAAVLPPSGAGRRRGTITPLDPSVTCACAPST
jgi:hypothetical protein